MAKAPKFGVNNYRGATRRKRPGRHAKKPNKSFSRKIYRGQGRWKKKVKFLDSVAVVQE